MIRHLFLLAFALTTVLSPSLSLPAEPAQREFELVVNLKTAKALGITISESILVRADEVIR